MYTVDKCSINNFKQNKIRYIISDSRKYLGLTKEQSEGLRIILLARGVNKWLVCRSLIMKLKANWKKQISQLQKEEDGKRAAMLGVARKQLRDICRLDRWQPNAD